MGKHVIQWSYWLGAVLAVLALVARALNMFGLNTLAFTTKGNEISYHSFVEGALLFFVISIATSSYVRHNS
jgi:hypothetical protein